MNRRILYALVLICTVAACAPKSLEFPKPPAARLVCPDEPALPDAPVTDEANGEYLKGLRAAWAGCRADVDWLRDYFDRLP